jgi:hypothetical protein
MFGVVFSESNSTVMPIVRCGKKPLPGPHNPAGAKGRDKAADGMLRRGAATVDCLGLRGIPQD